MSTVILAGPPSERPRSFLHEFPAEHPALDLGSRHDARSSIAVLLGDALDLWLDAVEAMRGPSGRGELPTHPAAVVEALDLERQRGDREAPDSTVYRIARDDRARIAELCANPRAMLRRDRQLVAVGRVRELDSSCMRWLDMQPGRTIAEKAGARQRLRAVVRTQSLATLENRVLRDLLIRARDAALSYVRQNARFASNTRVRAVKRLVSDLAHSLAHSEVAKVPALTGMPSPNYVLQNDRRYRYVWNTWLALVRKQQLTQSLLWWSGRWCSELAFLGALRALSDLEGKEQRYLHDIQWRTEPHHGEFLDSAAPIGSFFLRRDRRLIRIDVLRASQAARGNWPLDWWRWIELAPDIAVIPGAPDLEPLLVWSVVVCDGRQRQVLERSLQGLEDVLQARRLRAVVVLVDAEVQNGENRLTEPTGSRLLLMRVASPALIPGIMIEATRSHLHASEPAP